MIFAGADALLGAFGARFGPGFEAVCVVADATRLLVACVVLYVFNTAGG